MNEGRKEEERFRVLRLVEVEMAGRREGGEMSLEEEEEEQAAGVDIAMGELRKLGFGFGGEDGEDLGIE